MYNLGYYGITLRGKLFVSDGLFSVSLSFGVGGMFGKPSRGVILKKKAKKSWVIFKLEYQQGILGNFFV